MMRNPTDLVDSPRIACHEMTSLNPEQANAFMVAAETSRHRGLYVLAMTTGMRQGELLALRWKDVDLEAGVLSVTGTLQLTPGGGLIVEEPTTHRSRRQVVLAEFARDALLHHRVEQVAAADRAGSLWKDHGYVFPNIYGGPQYAEKVRVDFKRLLTVAKCPAIRFHDLRHTAATLMLGQGVHPKIVSEMLGHSTIAITLDLYSHVTPAMQREAARTMNSLLTGGVAAVAM